MFKELYRVLSCIEVDLSVGSGLTRHLWRRKMTHSLCPWWRWVGGEGRGWMVGGLDVRLDDEWWVGERGYGIMDNGLWLVDSREELLDGG